MIHAESKNVAAGRGVNYLAAMALRKGPASGDDSKAREFITALFETFRCSTRVH